MYDRFEWTRASRRRNRLTVEYEPLQPFFLMALADRAGCRTFIDIGANIGVYALFATLIPTVGRVAAFEADANTANELRQNVALNNLKERIEVHTKAVSNESGTLTFGSMGGLSGANGVVSTSIHDASTFRGRFEVEATRLDDFLVGSDAREPLALKIDVEGHEPAVLDGAKSTLQSHAAVIQIECYEARAESGRRLRNLGFGHLTAIGPDHYFTNIARLRDPGVVVSVYESAAQNLIDYQHRDRPLTIERGNFKLEIVGKSAHVARGIKGLIRR